MMRSLRQPLSPYTPEVLLIQPKGSTTKGATRKFRCALGFVSLYWGAPCDYEVSVERENRMKSAFAFLLAIYVLAAACLAIFQRRLMYFPDRRLTHPAEAGMSGTEELRLKADDGKTLIAWHLPPRQGRPLILYFHGNGGALADRVPRFRMFAASGYGFLAVSYRGYGGSAGSPTQIGLMRDGEAAYREAKHLGYSDDRIVLMGESLGTGIATVLAATRKAAALVLDSPFSSAADAAAAHYPIFPVRWFMIDQFRSDLAIRNVNIPVLIVHGDGDGVIPIALAKRLFERANEPKAFITVAGGGHLVLGLPEVFARVRVWIDGTAGLKPHDRTAFN
jgi:uncharacterized protein